MLAKGRASRWGAWALLSLMLVLGMWYCMSNYYLTAQAAQEWGSGVPGGLQSGAVGVGLVNGARGRGKHLGRRELQRLTLIIIITSLESFSKGRRGLTSGLD